MTTHPIDDIYTPLKFAKTFGKGAGRAGGDMSESTARRIFKSPGFPARRNGRMYFAFETQIKKWIESGGRIDEQENTDSRAGE